MSIPYSNRQLYFQFHTNSDKTQYIRHKAIHSKDRKHAHVDYAKIANLEMQMHWWSLSLMNAAFKVVIIFKNSRVKA